jgi:hypothetical protein
MITHLFRGALALMAIGASLLFINAPDKAPFQILSIVEEAATGNLQESDALYIYSPSTSPISSSCLNSASATCRGA